MVVGHQDVHARAVLPVQDGRRGHGDRRLGAHVDLGPGEHARAEAAAGQGDARDPQAALGVHFRRDDANPAGGLADLVRRDCRRLTCADQSQFGLGHLGVELQPAVADHAEHLGPGLDDLAAGDAAADDQARDRRPQGRLVEPGLGLGQGGPRRGQVGGRGALIGQSRVQRRLAEEAAFLQFLRTGQGGLIAGEVGLGGLDARLLLTKLGSQQGVVELDEGLALTDVGAFIDIDGRGDQAAGLGADGHLFPGRDAAGCGDDARLAGHRSRRHCDGRAGGRRSAGLFPLLLLASAACGDGQAQAEDKREGRGAEKAGRGRGGHGAILYIWAGETAPAGEVNRR